eukprot:Pgem_evm1s14179
MQNFFNTKLLPQEKEEGKVVKVTNGKGAFSSSLAEYVIAASLLYNKNIAKLRTLKKEKKWDQ